MRRRAMGLTLVTLMACSSGGANDAIDSGGTTDAIDSGGACVQEVCAATRGYGELCSCDADRCVCRCDATACDNQCAYGEGYRGYCTEDGICRCQCMSPWCFDAGGDADADADEDACADVDAESGLVPCEGGLYDPTSNLCWEDPPNDLRKVWDDAVSYCQTFDPTGESAGRWHLPTISELRSFVRGCPDTTAGGACRVTDETVGEPWARDPACDGCGGRAGPACEGNYWDPSAHGDSGGGYWSSASYWDDWSFAWGIFFSDASLSGYAKTSMFYVRCVRPRP